MQATEKDVTWLSEEEQRHWRALVTAITLLNRRLNADMLAAHDLSVDDYAILAMLSEAPDDRLRFGELAGVLRVPKAHVTYRFRRLESRGLVQREACETDARGAYAVLTPEGRRRIEEAAPSHVESVRALVLDHLTPEQLRCVGEAMRAIVDADCAETPDRY
ncbi:MarR family winged helix-turn-helix transcriptional regulator [Euzebya sp.]|uniref:MarR family winged helix-turn-helix transcriptional regulator n=1 Tax=Euzebya sp. TaxID=1971409 RepID=UPI0035149AE6